MINQSSSVILTKLEQNNNKFNLLTALNDSDNEIDSNIERMQTISIRKNNNNINKARRKSAYQSASIHEEKNVKINWNYDELNELKIKFLSLLSSAQTTESLTEINQDQRKDYYKYSTRNSLISQMISNEEHAKIESFYKSFGTQLHVTNNYATLYTMTLNDTNESKVVLDQIINLFMLNDDSAILKQNWTVCHRGIPLWLFNTGANPRRPYRQLKFTLAEKGTGFILWQDRIDLRSDFKIFRRRKNEASSRNSQKSSLLYSLYQDNLQDSSSSNFIITFKASDRKTLVFIKFDVYQEVFKFFNHYLKIHNKLCEEIRQRTKSLPTGFTNEIKKPQSILKYKRISKHDISLPKDIKHLINVRINEKNSYYTLSKLLPSISSNSLSTSSSILNEFDSNQNRFSISIISPQSLSSNNSSSSSTSSTSYKQLKTIK